MCTILLNGFTGKRLSIKQAQALSYALVKFVCIVYNIIYAFIFLPLRCNRRNKQSHLRVYGYGWVENKRDPWITLYILLFYSALSLSLSPFIFSTLELQYFVWSHSRRLNIKCMCHICVPTTACLLPYTDTVSFSFFSYAISSEATSFACFVSALCIALLSIYLSDDVCLSALVNSIFCLFPMLRINIDKKNEKKKKKIYAQGKSLWSQISFIWNALKMHLN